MHPRIQLGDRLATYGPPKRIGPQLVEPRFVDQRFALIHPKTLLTKLGVGLRIIDRTAEPGTTSRALGVQARTLEFYRQIGIADAGLSVTPEAASAGQCCGWARG